MSLIKLLKSHTRFKHSLPHHYSMTSNHASLDTAATERKARLAKLKSLKRKQHPTDSEEPDTSEIAPPSAHDSLPSHSESTIKYLSGRNYDLESRGPKLGFESAPNAHQETLEDQAAAIAAETREKEERQQKEEKPIDLFTLQPKKPNWDLKRDVARKMELLNARTENAIARLVRERLEGQKRKEVEGLNGVTAKGDDGENVGMQGVELVEGVHVREREEEEEIKRDMQEYAGFV